MSLPYNAILTGSFTSNGTSQSINLPSDISKFELYNITYFGSTAANAFAESAWWVSGLPAGYGYIANKTSGSATMALTTMATTGGFTLYNPNGTVLGSAVAITGTTNANPVVVSTSSTAGLTSGATVRLNNTSGAYQLTGDWTVNTIVANTSFNLAYTGTAPGSTTSAGTWSLVNVSSPWYPKVRRVTAITAASSAVITMAVTHTYTVGQLVRIYVPAGWGMTQMNGQLATVTAINTTTNTITVNINSTAYSTFVVPSSASYANGVNVPQVVPVGETANVTYANLLDDATINQASYQMQLGSSVLGSNNDVIQWIAYRTVTLS